jgi:hypothetical protein
MERATWLPEAGGSAAAGPPSDRKSDEAKKIGIGTDLKGAIKWAAVPRLSPFE